MHKHVRTYTTRCEIHLVILEMEQDKCLNDQQSHWLLLATLEAPEDATLTIEEVEEGLRITLRMGKITFTMEP